ncbi:unnamed protein product [Pleuronectes platessa]|uniref:Uncharacterized protein n=1 Tax=Pleuronectes platessa TaxID=8262 RepID=A0A9N7V426_PLEPL|nr:unnamed protein product [Pleuronectes platessa]
MALPSWLPAADEAGDADDADADVTTASHLALPQQHRHFPHTPADFTHRASRSHPPLPPSLPACQSPTRARRSGSDEQRQKHRLLRRFGSWRWFEWAEDSPSELESELLRCQVCVRVATQISSCTARPHTYLHDGGGVGEGGGEGSTLQLQRDGEGQ